jgi:hypothetical protein
MCDSGIKKIVPSLSFNHNVGKAASRHIHELLYQEKNHREKIIEKKSSRKNHREKNMEKKSSRKSKVIIINKKKDLSKMDKINSNKIPPHLSPNHNIGKAASRHINELLHRHWLVFAPQLNRDRLIGTAYIVFDHPIVAANFACRWSPGTLGGTGAT